MKDWQRKNTIISRDAEKTFNNIQQFMIKIICELKNRKEHPASYKGRLQKNQERTSYSMMKS